MDQVQFSAVGAISFILAIALTFFILGAIAMELFSGSYRRAVNTHTRNQLLDLAERRRPGRLRSQSDRRAA